MNIKLPTILIAGAALGAILLAGPCPVIALERPASGSGLRAQIANKIQETAIDNLKKRANQEIDRRITSLTKWLTRLNAAKHLTVDDKTTLTSLVQTAISDLTALKTKINEDNDINTLRADVQSIVKDYRVYLLLHPKLGLIVASDTVLANADKLSELATKLEVKIEEDKNTGKDVTNLEAKLTDLKNKIADAKTQVQKIHDTIMPLTPEGYPGNKSVIQAAVALLKTAHTDLKTSRDDAREIAKLLKADGLKLNKPATPSATTVLP